MNRFIFTLSEGLFNRLLAYAPESLQREAQKEARRAIPAFCFTEDDIRWILKWEEGWDRLTDAEHAEAITDLLEASRYKPIAIVVKDVIAEAAINYLADVLMEKDEQGLGSNPE